MCTVQLTCGEISSVFFSLGRFQDLQFEFPVIIGDKRHECRIPPVTNATAPRDVCHQWGCVHINNGNGCQMPTMAARWECGASMKSETALSMQWHCSVRPGPRNGAWRYRVRKGTLRNWTDQASAGGVKLFPPMLSRWILVNFQGLHHHILVLRCILSAEH